MIWSIFFDLLVVEDDIWEPDVLSRDVQVFDFAVVLRIPLQFVIDPFL